MTSLVESAILTIVALLLRHQVTREEPEIFTSSKFFSTHTLELYEKSYIRASSSVNFSFKKHIAVNSDNRSPFVTSSGNSY